MINKNMKKTLELYFHIPFCARKCLYCDFLSGPSDAGTQEAYLQTLLLETEERAAKYADYQVDTIFIGGGTPSIVKEEWIEKLLKIVYDRYEVSPTAEITIEVNPGTVTEAKLQTYYRAGINRLSIGLQSAHNEELKQLGRIHTYEEFLDTYKTARKVGFTNINVDVMSALPGQSLESYLETLDRILSLEIPPEHISAYSLIVEEGTVFWKLQEQGRLPLPDEDTERMMYRMTAKKLEQAGWKRYEISNYAKEGYTCRHNEGYWRRHNYLGLGIGAASMVDNVRFQNETDLDAYLEHPLECRSGEQRLSRKDQMEEFLFLGLRMVKGVSKQEFFETFGVSMETIYGDVLSQNQKDGLLVEQNEGGIRWIALTERGLDLSNYVMAQFLLDE